MNWRLAHIDVGVNDDSEIVSKSSVYLEQGDMQISLSSTLASDIHVMSAKRALMDAAYKLEKMAIEMKHKAEKYQ